MASRICDPSLIKKFEGLRLRAYQCQAGVWTIGYGHTGPGVHDGLIITREQAEFVLRRDLRKFEACVERCVRVPLSENQFSALVSLAFNIGEHAFSTSTLVRRLNEGEYVLAADEFLRWNKVRGKVNTGLTTRREEERKLFLTP